MWQAVHIGRLWPVLEWTHVLYGEICSKEKWLLIQVQATFFTLPQLLNLYEAQIRPCLEYGLHLWRRASKHSLTSLDPIYKRSTLTASLSSLANRRSALQRIPHFIRYFYGMCSDELKSVIPPKHAFGVARALPIPKILLQLNWKSAGPYHLPLRLSLWLQGTGTLFRLPSFLTLISFRSSRLVSTNAFASRLSVDQFPPSLR